MVNQYRGETPFEVDGVSYFLYLGLNELAALETEWGTVRLPGEAEEQWAPKRQQFLERLFSPNNAELRSIFREGLRRWARLNRNGATPLDDEAVGQIMELSPPALREIHALVLKNSFGVKSEDQDPNAPGGEPSTSKTS